MENPYQAPEHSGDGPIDDFDASGIEVAEPLFHNRGWLKFVGIMSILYGVLVCLSIIGIIFGWIPILVGVKLLNCSQSLTDGYPSMNTAEVKYGIGELSSAIKFLGIFAIIMLSLMLLYFTFIIGLVVFGVLSSPDF